MKSIRFVPVLALVALAACTPGDTVSTRTARGNPNAAVTVTEYADLQCPACASAYSAIEKPLLQKYGNSIKYEYKHFPLRSIHRFALDAAEASECAADQGKFWEFTDYAFEHQKDLSYEALSTWAGELGLNVDDFNKCWKSKRKRDLVLADYEEGRTKGVAGTPTFFINGEQVETDLTTMSAKIDAILGSAGTNL